MPYQLPQAFHYQPDLHLEQVAISQLANQIGTPFYAYSQTTLMANIERCQSACEPHEIAIHYAMKANSNLTLLKLIAAQGLGVDIVSGGELTRALAAGFDPAAVVFSGVGKSRDELIQALESGVGQINLESVEEYQLLSELCAERQQSINTVVRVNPEVSVNTHPNITTGSRGNKFGIALDQLEPLFAEAAQQPWVKLQGLAMHIGSQIKEVEPYIAAITKLCQLAEQLLRLGYRVDLLDLGGGFGIDEGDGQKLGYAELVEAIVEATSGFTGKLAIEPGRSLVADCGVLVTGVNYRKAAQPRPFLILDAAMNDLMRPALYQACHPLLPVETVTEAVESYDVVGPVCESTDTFARNLQLPAGIKAGDLMVFALAGAYSAVMSNSYNSRALVPEVLIRDGQATVIRPRISPQTLMEFESSTQVITLDS